MRKLFFWLHLCMGVAAGLIIFIMSVTGVLLTYEKQMVAWFDLKNLPPVQGGNRLQIETLLTQARAARGSMPSAIAISADTSVPAQLTFGRDVVYQDPSTGQILGGTNTSARQFFRVVTDWHRWLAMSGENRPAGRAATGAANLAFLFIVLSGAYLWIPRIWNAASVRAVALFRGGLSGKARDFNWHNVIGIWCFVPLAFIVASASVISYPWASNLVYRLAGSPLPAPAAPPRPAGAATAEPDLAGLNNAWNRASAYSADWRVLTLRLANSENAPLVFVIDRGYAGQPQKRVTLTLDRKSSAIESAESFDDFNRGRKIRTWLRFVHTGEFYGLPGQTLAGIATLGAALLTFTGIALALRRLSAWRLRRTRARQTVAEVESVS